MIDPRARRLAVVASALFALSACTSPRPMPASTGSAAPGTTDAPRPSASAAFTAAPSQSAAVSGQPSDAPTVVPTPAASPGTPSASASAPPASDPPASETPTGAFNPDAITLGLEPFASGFSRMTFVTHAGDGTGTLYALEQAGRVVIVTPGDTQSGGILLNIGDRVRSGGEQGLLGLAFHPDFESNGRFFVNYTNTAGNTVVSEFVRGADGVVDAAAERVLLRVEQPFPNHNGGMLAFGSDGYLYIALGDGGAAGDPLEAGQDLGVHLAKILRIDVNSGDPYGIPADNPFADGANGALPEVWSYGVRNPWRFSFDRQTGAMFMADVGQNVLEEINVEPAGEGGRNYGWNIMEGDRCYEQDNCTQRGLTLPVATYSHDEGCSVTGGYVYRGTAFPDMFGAYVFADYCTGTLWALDGDRAVAGQAAPPIVMGDLPFAASSFGEDEAGELYVVNHDGAIHRLVAIPR